jgi:hypothetical protein
VSATEAPSALNKNSLANTSSPWRGRFAVGLLFASVGLSFAQVPPAPTEERKRALEELRLGRLPMPEAARLAGKPYAREFNLGSFMVAPDLESLMKFSEVVVVAEVIAGHPSLSTDQMYISTVSSVRVTEQVKGNVAAGSSLKVVVPGGKMTFPDGTSAETTTRDLEPLKPGSRYVLFLESNDKGGQAEYVSPEARGGYMLKLGPQGVFELGANTVKAQGRQIDLVKQQNNGISSETFLAKLRKAREVAGKPAR